MRRKTTARMKRRPEPGPANGSGDSALVPVWAKSFGDADFDQVVKAVGVSNFTRADLESLLPACTTVPAVDQIQWYIGLDVADIQLPT